jgi:hypothetical protein
VNLKKRCAKDIMAELEGAHGREALSFGDEEKSRHFANGSITLENDPRSGRSPQSDLSESVRPHIEESPFTLGKRMFQKFRTAKPTCLRILQRKSWAQKM